MMKYLIRSLSMGGLLLSVYAQDSIPELEKTHVRLKHHENIKSGAEWFQDKKADVGSSLESEAGIQIEGIGNSTRKVNYRGISGEAIQYAVDGDAVVDVSASSADHDVSLAMGGSQNIEVLRGAALVRHSLALSGVRVDLDNGMFLSTPLPETSSYLGLMLNTMGWGGNLYGGVDQGVGSLNLRSQFEVENYQEYQSPQKVYAHTNRENLYGALATQWTSGSSMFSAQLSTLDKEYGIPPLGPGGHANGVLIEINKNDLKLGVESPVHSWKQRSTFQYTEFYQSESEFGDGVHRGNEYLIQNYQVNSDWDYSHLGTHFGHGVDYQFQNNQFGASNKTPSTGRHQYGFWSEFGQHFKESQIELGLRAEGFTDAFALSSTELSLEAQDRITWSWYMGYDRDWLHSEGSELSSHLGVFQTSQLPSIEGLYSQGPHLANYTYEIGNPDLKSELGYGSEVMIDYKGSVLEFSLELYSTYYPTYHSSVPTGEIDWGTELEVYQMNGVEAQVSGVSLGLEKQVSLVELGLQFDYTHGDNLSDQAPLAMMPPARVMLIQGYSSAWGDWELRETYYHSQERLAQFESKTPSATQVDLSWSETWYIFKASILRTQLGVQNLMDEVRQNHLNKNKDLIYESGRSLYAKIDLKF